MDFSHLNKILEKSFSHVGKDILLLKESQKKNLEKIKKAYDDFHKEIKNAATELKSDTVKKKEVLRLYEKISIITSDLDELNSHTVKKNELNARLLPLHAKAKAGAQANKQIKSLSRKIEALNQKTSKVEKENAALEEGMIDIAALKAMIKNEVKKSVSPLKEKIKSISQIEKGLDKTGEKITNLEKQAKNLVTQKEHGRAVDNIKKQAELMISEINRLEAETVKNSGLGQVKARVTKAEQRIKEIAKFRSDAKDIKRKLAKFTRNLQHLNAKLKLDQNVLEEEEKKADIKTKQTAKKVQVKAETKKKTARKTSKKTASRQEARLFQQAIDSVINYFTETPKDGSIKAVKNKNPQKQAKRTKKTKA